MNHRRIDMRRPGARYLVIGVSVYLFELLVIVIAQAAGASTVTAVGLSFWLCRQCAASSKSKTNVQTID